MFEMGAVRCISPLLDPRSSCGGRLMGKRLVGYAAKAIVVVKKPHPALMGELLPGRRDDQKAGRSGPL